MSKKPCQIRNSQSKRHGPQNNLELCGKHCNCLTQGKSWRVFLAATEGFHDKCHFLEILKMKSFYCLAVTCKKIWNCWYQNQMSRRQRGTKYTQREWYPWYWNVCRSKISFHFCFCCWSQKEHFHNTCLYIPTEGSKHFAWCVEFIRWVLLNLKQTHRVKFLRIIQILNSASRLTHER